MQDLLINQSGPPIRMRMRRISPITDIVTRSANLSFAFLTDQGKDMDFSHRLRSFRGRSLCVAVMLVLVSGVATADEPYVDSTLRMTSYDDLLNRVAALESQAATRQTAFTQQPDQGGIYFGVEHVWLKTVYSNATAFYEHDTFVNVPEGAMLTEFDPDLEPSSRGELGYLLPNSNLGWRARYWFFDSGDTRQSRSNVDVKIGVADDPDIAIDTVSMNDVDFLIAHATTDLQVYDFEGMTKRCFGKHLVTFSAGVRYAEIKHRYDGQDVSPDTFGIDTRLTTNHRYEGLGPTIALATRREIMQSGFGLNVGGRGSLLFGETRARWDRTQPLTPPPAFTGDSILHTDNWRMVPVFEMQLGLDYRQQIGDCWLEVGAGAEAQAWMNGGTPMNGGQDGATDSDRISSPFDEDFGLIGGYVRGMLKY